MSNSDEEYFWGTLTELGPSIVWVQDDFAFFLQLKILGGDVKFIEIKAKYFRTCYGASLESLLDTRPRRRYLADQDHPGDHGIQVMA